MKIWLEINNIIKLSYMSFRLLKSHKSHVNMLIWWVQLTHFMATIKELSNKQTKNKNNQLRSAPVSILKIRLSHPKFEIDFCTEVATVLSMISCYCYTFCSICPPFHRQNPATKWKVLSPDDDVYWALMKHTHVVKLVFSNVKLLHLKALTPNFSTSQKNKSISPSNYKCSL